MMQDSEKANQFFYEDPEELELPGLADENEEDSQDDIDQQIRRESSVHILEESTPEENVERPQDDAAWRLPPNLDPEWLALEVYTEADDLESEDGQDINEDSAYASHRPSSSGQEPIEANLGEDLSKLKLERESPSSSPAQQVTSPTNFSKTLSPKISPFGPIRSSLSLLEMLIRLTALQQFQQASHLSIPDELLTFFLEESSTTGAGGDGDERRRTRREARQKVGFDPYDESPVKRHGEDYQYQNQGQEYEAYRGGTPYDEYEPPMPSPRWHNERTPDNWLLRSRESSGPRRSTPDIPPSSPISPYRPVVKNAKPLDRVQQQRRGVAGSPLGRGMSVDTDSSLGTSPGSPTLTGKVEKGDEV
jgi:hypothetical protein